jgi:hypothetical protein
MMGLTRAGAVGIVDGGWGVDYRLTDEGEANPGDGGELGEEGCQREVWVVYDVRWLAVCATTRMMRSAKKVKNAAK